MALYNVGKTIREARIRLGVSQEELCFGICSTPTLSKIEGCKQNPNKKTMEALLQRLGLPVGIYNISVTETEFERARLEREITNKIANSSYDIQDLLEQYRNLSENMDSLEEQFYLFMKALYRKSQRATTQELQSLFEQALQCTIPDFTLQKLETRPLMTELELMILNSIARTEYMLHHKDSAINCLYNLRDYFLNRPIDSTVFGAQYPVILFNLSNWEGLRKNFEAELSLADEGVRVCNNYGKLAFYDLLIFNKAFALASLNKKDEADCFFRQAFAIMEAKGKKFFLKYGIKRVNKCFNYTFSEK